MLSPSAITTLMSCGRSSYTFSAGFERGGSWGQLKCTWQPPKPTSREMSRRRFLCMMPSGKHTVFQLSWIIWPLRKTRPYPAHTLHFWTWVGLSCIIQFHHVRVLGCGVEHQRVDEFITDIGTRQRFASLIQEHLNSRVAEGVSGHALRHRACRPAAAAQPPLVRGLQRTGSVLCCSVCTRHPRGPVKHPLLWRLVWSSKLWTFGIE